VRFSPVLAELGQYPFTRLDEAKRRLAADGVQFIDFGIGDPQEPIDPRIKQALVDGLEDRMGYPLAGGLPELRDAVAAWVERRFAVTLDPATEILPTLGSKEAIFSLAQVMVSPEKDLVIATEPGYPVQERGARFAGADVLHLPLRELGGFLPDLRSLAPGALERCAIFWVNYPNNPTGAVAPLEFYEELAALARANDFLLASDEAYTELYFGPEAPVSALQLEHRDNVAVFNTLSKRSSMTGYRSGFVAGDPALIAALKQFRPTVGTAPQVFVQRAAVAAWSDEEHVDAMRELYRRKRDILLSVLREKEIRPAGSEATMYLWLEVPDAYETSEAFATRLLEVGIVVSPGSFFGPAGEGYFRMALVPTEDECARAAELLREAL
jgi:succinyldiaminopimelate transaminase